MEVKTQMPVVFRSEVGPIMIILTKEEKELIANMSPNDFKFCAYPDDWTKEEIEEFMRDK